MTLRALFETHIKVQNLQRSKTFYEQIVGLDLAFENAERQVAFFWIGGRGNSMIGLWAGDAPVQQTIHHMAFRADLSDVLEAPAKLKQAGIQALDFFNEPTIEPSVIGWMPAASIYFLDPDGHLLEYLAMLPGEPRPEAGVVPYSRWIAVSD